MKTMMIRLLAAAALCALPTAADAALTYTVQNGKLTGVSGVMFKDQSFDVAFVEGKCIAAYSTCQVQDDLSASIIGDSNDVHSIL